MLHAALDEYAIWKREKDQGWREDWEQAAVRRGHLFEAVKRHLADRVLADLEQSHVEALQQKLLATGMPLDDINATTSLLKDACRHAGAVSWYVHPLSTPEEVREARAQYDQIRDGQLRDRRKLFDTFASSSAERRRHGWVTLEEARKCCADLLSDARVAGAAAIADGTRLETRFISLPGPTAIGGSRLGGAPDGPSNFRWPTSSNDAPLAFLFQLDLASLPEVRSELPHRGRLLFFYDLEQMPWGFAPSHAHGWKVIYDDSEKPVPAPVPAAVPDASRFGPARVELYQVPELPPHWSPELRELPAAVLDRYHALAAELDRFDTRHQVQGVPDPHQGHEMDLECQLVSNGLDCGKDWPESPRATELAAGAADWMLLLQLDSDFPIGFELGGRLFFWIRRQDLRSRNFDGVWVIYQS